MERQFYELQGLPVWEEIAEFPKEVKFPPVSIWPFRWPSIHRVVRCLWKLGGEKVGDNEKSSEYYARSSDLNAPIFQTFIL